MSLVLTFLFEYRNWSLGYVTLCITLMSFYQILSILLKKNLASRLEFGCPFLEDPNSCQEVELLAATVPKSAIT